MKILFVSRLFHDVSGGVERMAIAMMNEFCRRGHAVELLSWDAADAQPHYEVDERVVWHKLDMGDANKKASLGLRLRRQLAMRKLLKQIRPDTMIAFQHGPFLTVAMASLGLGIPVIAAERNAPQRFDHLRAGKHRNLIYQTFRLATRITVQMDDYAAAYPDYLKSRIVSIPNPVLPASMTARPAGTEDKEKILLTVGRLSYQKNQASLIQAFDMLAARYPQWHLQIVGAGEDEGKLRQQAEETGLGGRIEFVGAVKDVSAFYCRAHLFCLPSRWEGFPNALAEAMAHGLPVVGFADCAGVGQLIDQGRSGSLAPGNGDTAALAAVLAALMSDDALRARMGEAASASMERFSPALVFDRWEALFREIGKQ